MLLSLVVGLVCAGCYTTIVRLPNKHGMTFASSVQVIDQWAKVNSHPDYQDAAGATAEGWVIYDQRIQPPPVSYSGPRIYLAKVIQMEYAHNFRDIDHVELEVNPAIGAVGGVFTLFLINPAAYACQGRIVMKDGSFRRLVMKDMEFADERVASYKTCFPMYLFFPTRPYHRIKKLALDFEFMRVSQQTLKADSSSPGKSD